MFLLQIAVCCGASGPVLEAVPDSCVALEGCVSTLAVTYGPCGPGDARVLLGSVTGTQPFPLEGCTVFLTPDIYTFSLEPVGKFVPFSPPAKPSADAYYVFSIPELLFPQLAGVQFHHAWLTFDLDPVGLRSVSNTATISLL